MTRPATGSVRVGEYALEVGAPAGSFAQFELHREEENARALAEALRAAEEPSERRSSLAALEELREDAADVTDRIDRAQELFRAAVEGRLLERDVLAGEVDALLDVLERLDREGRFDAELRLARALHGLLVLAFRWLDLVRSLRSALAASRAAGDEAGQAWALHELGSLHLCAGDPDGAAEHLREAIRLEEKLGDFAGRCPTRHNLDSARRDAALRASRPRRLLRLAGLAAILALLGGAGYALAVGRGQEEGGPPAVGSGTAPAGVEETDEGRTNPTTSQTGAADTGPATTAPTETAPSTSPAESTPEDGVVDTGNPGESNPEQVEQLG